MSQPPDTSNPFDPFGFWKNTQGQTLDAWSKAMIDLVNTDAYAEATGRMLDSYLTVSAPMRKLMEQTMAQVLGQMNLPTRTEVLSLAERLTNMEMRLDDLDARLDAILRAVERTGQAVTTAVAANAKSAQASAAHTTPMPARRIERTSASTPRRAPTTPE
jgi:hypothetical protein